MLEQQQKGADVAYKRYEHILKSGVKHLRYNDLRLRLRFTIKIRYDL